MFRTELNEHSPLRVLDSTLGEPRPGRLGVVMARAGVGKTAFLVQVGIDALLREHKVFHVGVDSTVDRVRSWYDELFADLGRVADLEDPHSARLLIERNRMIQTYPAHKFDAEKLRAVTAMLAEHADFRPAHILLDGLDWEELTDTELNELKSVARQAGGELWCTALTHRDETGPDVVDELPPPVAVHASEIDVAIFLQPRSNHVDLRVLRGAEDHDTPLHLDPDTLRLVDHREDEEFPAVRIDPARATVYSGGAPGTEAAFGELAQAYGLQEVNFTFEGHNPARDRGLVALTEKQLRQGDVSLAYVSRRMNRSYTSSPTFRKVLQSIWHQVNHSQQVLVVGVIQADGTVKGGTGWGAELARVWNKPLWVFDQERKGWFRWNGTRSEWTPARTPRLISNNVCGTGTRFLNEDGRQALQDVFAATFDAQ